jgi:hypothetical protein
MQRAAERVIAGAALSATGEPPCIEAEPRIGAEQCIDVERSLPAVVMPAPAIPITKIVAAAIMEEFTVAVPS